MTYSNIFVDPQLPEPLKKEEICEYFEKMKNGDIKAREKIIYHNIRLVIHEVGQKFSKTPYELKELVSIGIIGLIKSVDSFDSTKGYPFATYATKCIDNEILMFLRKERKHAITSLEQPIIVDENKKEITYKDFLCDTDIDITSDYEEIELYTVIREVINKLPERDKTIVMMYFGFINNKPMTQKEIANKLGFAQSYISRLLKKIINEISVQLKKLGITDLSFEQISINKDKKTSKKLKTLYEYFNNYTKAQVDEMLSKLDPEDRALITLRYGNDLEHPVTSREWNNKKSDEYYICLIPRMKKLLENPESKLKKRRNKNITKSDSLTEKSTCKKEQKNTNVPIQPQQDNNTEAIPASLEIAEEPILSKDDYIKSIKLLKTPSFGQMLDFLSIKEAIIVCLRLGYVDGKYFSSSSIADFLGIELEEVIEITKKALVLYKDKINGLVDKAVELTLQDSKIK